MTEKVRFLIVGASYAGSLLAAKLAGSGSTFIADRSLPGARMNCGGGVHAETFKRLEVEIPFVETDSILMSVLGKETSFPCRYVVIDRTLLNKALFDKAKAAGAEFALMSYSSRNESAKTARFALPEGGEREITYEKIVFADGFHPKGCRIEQPPPMSPSNRNFPAGAAKARIIEGNTTRPNTLYFRITEDNPCGYSWLFPMPGGRLNIGAGGFASTGVSEEWISEMREMEGVTGCVLTKGGGVFPVRPFKKVMDGDTYLFGDAAGMVYALNGEGLKHIRDTLNLWSDSILNGSDLNSAWRRSATYYKLAFASKALRGTRKLSKTFKRPLYPPICRLAAFSRRIVKM